MQVSGTRNLQKNTADNEYDTDDASRKHSPPVKRHSFGHVRASFMRWIELPAYSLRSIRRKKIVI